MTSEEKKQLEELDKKVDEVAGVVSEIRTALTGINGHGGLLVTCELRSVDCHQKFELVNQRFEKLAEDYYHFKRACFIVFGVLIGTGVLGGSGWWIYEAISR